MKVRLISKTGDGLGLLHRLSQEGHDCSFWVKTKKAEPGYAGILPRVNDWRSGLTKDTTVLIDMVGFGGIADSLRKSGLKTYGGGKLNDTLEFDRQFAMKVAKASGLKVPQWENFKSFDKAIDFVNTSDRAWVFKPQNNKSPAFTYVSTDSEDMAEMLEYFSGTWKGDVDFLLQEKIEGCEVSCEAYYVNGELVSNSINSTIEQKRFLNDDLGPNIGCASSLVWFWPEKQPNKWAKRMTPATATIYRLTLKKLEPFLKMFKYSGPLDVNTIVSAKDHLPYFLEGTSRFGYSAVYALAEGLNMELGEFFSTLAEGKMPELKPSFDWLGAVRISVPPYPSEENASKSANRPIRGINDLEHYWLLDAKFEDGKLLSAGVDGVLMEVSGREKDLTKLGKQIYNRISVLQIPDMQYRTDLVENAKPRLKMLRDYNYF